MVDLEPVVEEDDKKFLFEIIQNTSPTPAASYASHLLQDWTEMFPRFVKVMPIDYKLALERHQERRNRGKRKSFR